MSKEEKKRWKKEKKRAKKAEKKLKKERKRLMVKRQDERNTANRGGSSSPSSSDSDSPRRADGRDVKRQRRTSSHSPSPSGRGRFGEPQHMQDNRLYRSARIPSTELERERSRNSTSRSRSRDRFGHPRDRQLESPRGNERKGSSAAEPEKTRRGGDGSVVDEQYSSSRHQSYRADGEGNERRERHLSEFRPRY
jgi:hypothetical protein